MYFISCLKLSFFLYATLTFTDCAVVGPIEQKWESAKLAENVSKAVALVNVLSI